MVGTGVGILTIAVLGGGEDIEGGALNLAALALDTNTINEGDPENTLVGTIQNNTGGSAVTMQDGAGSRFKVTGDTVVCGSVATDYETATNHNITLRETLGGYDNSPRDTVLNIAVGNVLEGEGVNLLSKGDSVTNDSASYARLGAEETSPLLVYQNRAFNGTSVRDSTPNWIGQFAADMAFFDSTPDSEPKIWSVMLGNTLHHSGAGSIDAFIEYSDMIRRHANNVKVLLVGDFDRADSGYRTQRTTDEAWAIANVGLYHDGFVSMKTGLPDSMGADGAANNPTFYPTDGTHAGPLVHEGAAPLYTTAVDALSDDLLNGVSAPIIVRKSPLDGATLVQPDAILVARFNKHMKFTGTVDITIFNAAGDTVVEAFDETDIGVGLVINGVDLTITPTVDLPTGVSLYVQITSASLTDISDNAFAGIADKTSWNFDLPADVDLFTLLNAYWTLEEASGTREDSVGSNDLTDNNTVTQRTGKIGQAASFAMASSESLSIADNASIGFTGNFTVAGWVLRDPTGTPVNLMAKGDSTFGNDEWQITMPFIANRSLRFTVSASGGGSNNVAIGGLVDNTWTFFCCTYNATTRMMSISRNAGTRVTGDQSAGGVGAPAREARDLTLGRYGSGYHNGGLDEVGLWKRVLTVEEETWLYNSGNGRTYTEILATA